MASSVGCKVGWEVVLSGCSVKEGSCGGTTVLDLERRVLRGLPLVRFGDITSFDAAASFDSSEGNAAATGSSESSCFLGLGPLLRFGGCDFTVCSGSD